MAKRCTFAGICRIDASSKPRLTTIRTTFSPCLVRPRADAVDARAPRRAGESPLRPPSAARGPPAPRVAALAARVFAEVDARLLRLVERGASAARPARLAASFCAPAREPPRGSAWPRCAASQAPPSASSARTCECLRPRPVARAGCLVASRGSLNFRSSWLGARAPACFSSSSPLRWVRRLAEVPGAGSAASELGATRRAGPPSPLDRCALARGSRRASSAAAGRDDGQPGPEAVFEGGTLVTGRYLTALMADYGKRDYGSCPCSGALRQPLRRGAHDGRRQGGRAHRRAPGRLRRCAGRASTRPRCSSASRSLMKGERFKRPVYGRSARPKRRSTRTPLRCRQASP